MDVGKAQRDMCNAYFGGAPGLLVSSLVWMGGAIGSIWLATSTVILGFFVGGMFIHPASVVLNKLLGRSGKHHDDNPLGKLALENTAILIFSLPLVYATSLVRLEWFIPAMLLVVGGRFMTYATMFGMRLYWGLGGVMAVSAYALYRFDASFTVGAFTGAGLEFFFAMIAFYLSRKTISSSLDDVDLLKTVA